jgi:hypothetical protein
MADNSFRNTDLVAKRAMSAFLNALNMGNKVDRQYDSTIIFGKDSNGTVRIRRPVMYKSTTGAVIGTGDVSGIEQANVTMELDQREKVVVKTTSEELTLNIDDADRDIITPAMEELAQVVESYLTGLYDKVYNFVGTPGTAPATQAAVNEAKQKLDELGVPMNDRCAFYDPEASNSLATALTSVFPTGISEKAIKEAAITRYSNFDIFMNQSLKIHTVGAHGGTPLINGSAQNTTYALSGDAWSQTLNTDGWTNDIAGILKAGDVFTIAGVNSVNIKTRESTGQLQNFVVLADANSGSTTGPAALSISPPIISDSTSPYQTVTAAPADGAAIVVKTGTASAEYRQNLAFHKNAFTLAFGQLETPEEGTGAKSSRENFKGCSIRATRFFDGSLDSMFYRFDVFFGAIAQNPGFAVRTTG